MSTPESPRPSSPEATPVTPPPAYAPPAYGPSTASGYGAPAAPGYASSASGPYAPPSAPAPGPYGYPYGYAQPRTNVLSIVAMITSILGLIMIPFVGSVAGAVMGHIALRQVARTGENGRGMALAGVIVGWVGLALWVLLIGGLFALAFATSSYGSYTSYS